jgi:hypothetical protein
MFWSIHAWKANIEFSMHNDFPVWAMQTKMLTTQIETAKMKNERLFLIFSCKELSGQTWVYGLAEMTSIPCESSIVWPIRGPWDTQPCFQLKWLVKRETFRSNYPGKSSTGPIPDNQTYGVVKYLSMYTDAINTGIK